jgi:hypothetical protein
MTTTSNLRQHFGEKKKKKPLGPLAMALLIQVGLILIATTIVVLIPTEKEEPVFSAAKTIFLPQRELEHQMAVAEFQQAASSPMTMDKLTSSAMVPVDFPSLPQVPQIDFQPISESPVLSDTQALLGQSGLLGALSGVTTQASSVSLLGITDTAERVVIIFDVSGSVKNKAERANVPLEQIQRETIQLVEQLNANTLFGLVQFVRRYMTFEDYLMPATVDNKAAAVNWIRNEFITTGQLSAPRGRRGEFPRDPQIVDGIQVVLHTVLGWEPDVIFIISDGEFWRNPRDGRGNIRIEFPELTRDLRDMQGRLARPARIHFIGFEVRPERMRELQRLIGTYGGRIREF